MEIKHIIKAFDVKQDIQSIEKLEKGLINSTYLVTTKSQKYILQKVNTRIFKNIDAMMKNVDQVNKHLKKNNYKYECLSPIKTKNNENVVFDEIANPWRCFVFIEHKSYKSNQLNTEVMEEFGKGIGHFHACLADADTKEITSTIDNFHHTHLYFNTFKKAINLCDEKKKDEVRESFNFIQKFEDKFQKINHQIKSKQLALRVCHNDTKIDNILFESNGKRVKCIIDLDTIMSNSIIYDFGDAIRTSCNTTIENHTDFNKVDFNLNLFKSFAKGYADECKCFITKAEVDLLAFSPILLSVEQAIRFFTNYLEGGVYYKVSYAKQNLYRGYNQIALAKKILLKEIKMENYINSLFQS